MDERTAEGLLYVEATLRNRIAHNYWTIDDDVVWSVVSQHAPGLHHLLADEIAAARALLDSQNRLND